MTTQIRTAAVFASTALATVITALVLSTTSSQAQPVFAGKPGARGTVAWRCPLQ